MDDFLTRFWTDLTGRWSGPFAFRFFIQPAMAAFYAYRDGRKDAQSARTPYFRALFTEAHNRRSLLAETGQAVGRVAAIGVVIDALYQIIVLRWIYPMELLVMVFILAMLPYLVLRGLFTRVLRAGAQMRR